MAEIFAPPKPLTVNPLKMSAPLGGAMAFMGLDACMPMLHGAQGCTAFGLVALVRHFREGIPFQTTAMNEVATILGGLDNLEQALVNIATRAHPRIIGVCTTGLVETRGEDVAGDIRIIRQRHPELAEVALVAVETPDYVGALQHGWGKAVTAMIETLTEPVAVPDRRRVALLAGQHLSPGDIEELRELAEAFGLEPVVLPDLSGSVDGHVPDNFLGHTFGGTSVDDIRGLGRCSLALALGEHLRPAAAALHARAGVPFTVLDRLTGLGAADALVMALANHARMPVPARLKRQRSQLVDAMLDGHFYFGQRRIALAGEPDLLFTHASWLAEMGAEIAVAVTSQASPVLSRVPAERVVVGDLDDFERAAAAARCDLLITHSHGRQAAERLGLPLFRVGFPQFDRLGAAHQRSIGYRGTRDLIFAVANLLEEHPHHAPAAAH